MRAIRAVACGTVLAGISACTTSAGVEPSRMLPDHEVSIRGHRVTLHLAAGAARSAGPLVIYGTGDGGYPGDERLFDRMLPWGLPMAAFSAVDYLDAIDGPARVIGADALAVDLLGIIEAARTGLTLRADRPVLFVGFSRGAGLAISAATSPDFRKHLKGILAIALTAEEDFVTERVNGADRMLQTYDALPQLGALRVAVIQSTGDSFVTADEARRRFGPDSPTRRLRPIAARDHSFKGGLEALEREMKASVDWIVR